MSLDPDDASRTAAHRTMDGVDLVVASFLALYFELLFIRWMPATVHVLGYFTNLVLLAAFLGMGVGVARRSDSRQLGLRVLAALAGLVMATVALQIFPLDVTAPNVDYFINEIPEHVMRHTRVPLFPAIGVVFLTTALAFVPLGQLIGRSLARLPVLRGYALNILGSLLGIGAFSLVSALALPPAAWVGLGLAPLARFVKPRVVIVAGAVALILVTAGGEHLEARRTDARISWSPYYKIHVLDIPPPVGGNIVQVNNNFLLCALDLRPRPDLPPFLAGQRAYYRLLYAFVKPKRVLVLGAGAGNDCQMALLEGAESVTAVEIDPSMARFGRELNPARPLADPRVRVVVDDARSFLEKDHGTYDAVVFGTLDSHGLFSSMGSVRMENFVYTRECFRRAAEHLSPQGVMVVCVGPMADWVHARIARTVEAATGTAAQVYYFSNFLRPGDTSNLGVVVGPGATARRDVPEWRLLSPAERNTRWKEVAGAGLIATDDWPNVFLQDRSLPFEYVVVLGLVLVIGAGFVRVGMGGGRLSPELFLLGAGFMLLETKSITEMGLVFGVTWRVSSIVIATILLVILVATLVSERHRIPRAVTYPMLLASLVACWSIPTERLLVASRPGRLALATVYVGAPILMAALAFADAYRDTASVCAAFGSNLLGAVLGGVLEYSSMTWGLKTVYVIALATYTLAMLSGRYGSGRTRLEGNG